jgi:tRNA-splicing ligase RtcB
MSEIWEGPLEKIDDYRWRIPKTYKPGMRVDGIIYADEKLLKDIRHDKAAEQVANVAFLPGIVKASLAMPDIHWGYGFPIGGVAATDIEAGGVISPAGVGFDINCLDGNAFICNELGYKIRIKDYEKKLNKDRLICIDFKKEKSESTEIIRFLKQKPKRAVLEIITETDRQIIATSDHPFYTKDGMKEIGKIEKGEEVAIYPFQGVEYEEPNPDIIVDKEDIRKLLLKLGKTSDGRGIEQIINHLEKNNLLPLRYNSAQLPYLLKIMGYCFGDGLIYFTGKRKKGTVCFYGKEEDLKKIKEDLFKIGFRSGLYSRDRHHKIKTAYDTYEFDRKETWAKCSSNALAVLLAALGTPIGNKCYQPYELPGWLFRVCLWQKRLFLAGLFGAELSAPATLTGHGYNFYCPTLSMNKTKSSLNSGYKFLQDISKLLSEFGIFTHEISQRKEFVNKQGIVSYRLRLMISDKTDNLINLYSKVGFEYNEERKFMANCAVGYLRLKRQIIDEKKAVAALAPSLYESGNWDRECLYDYLTDSPYISERFVERSLYEPRKTEPRMWPDDPTFEEFIKVTTKGLGHSGMIWESIKSINKIEFDDYVYDFSVEHPHHNFIANNFVVSNCGVRMLRTSLQFEDIKDKIKDLTYALFNDVPAGIGSKGDIRVSAKEEREILVKGARWAVEKGYGTQDDLECTEEYGAIQGADPDAVSDRAYERGKAQSGTLGSGNHFLEIQVIDQLYDRDLCDTFGMDLGQITVMIHSGSRGLGYQVCDDYTRGMVHCLQKYNISVPDRQLSCAPVNSAEGQAYLGAMKCAANYAWANRQCLMYLTRKVFEKVLGMSWEKMGLYLIYDVAHNIAKIEKHIVDGKEKTVCVHRKGATRAFPAGHPALPERYKKTGQPVIIPGDMGRNSYLLVGTQGAMEETFGSTCHGAGRVKSRTAATKTINLGVLLKELEAKGITVKASGRGTIVEEAPQAYKDVNEVVNVVHNAGISKRVCRMRPLGVIKG